MDEELGSASVREQLIKAGISELENHGISDFSLRRVASGCNISCAAPYKHFKDKEALIDGIFDYIESQMNLLFDQVAAVYFDPKTRLIEICIAYIRFCIANPHFRAVLMLSGRRLPLEKRVGDLMEECFPKMEETDRKDRGYVIRSIAYGSALLIESGELQYSDGIIERIRKNIMRELEE
ncbi:MAG: TetR/AcrR family transcriptional regulator [Oscillospiraceae bacterium]|nr:TetR/AcrR family transcriptional regulator [Oscillospiraceae bacterium]